MDKRPDHLDLDMDVIKAAALLIHIKYPSLFQEVKTKNQDVSSEKAKPNFFLTMHQ